MQGIWLCWLAKEDKSLVPSTSTQPSREAVDDGFKIDKSLGTVLLKLMEMNDNHVEFHTVKEFPTPKGRWSGRAWRWHVGVDVPGQVPRGRRGWWPARRPAPPATYQRGRRHPHGGDMPDGDPQEAADGLLPLAATRLHRIRRRPQILEHGQTPKDTRRSFHGPSRASPSLLWTADYIPKNPRGGPRWERGTRRPNTSSASSTAVRGHLEVPGRVWWREDARRRVGRGLLRRMSSPT